MVKERKTMSNEKPFATGSGDIFKDFGFFDEDAAALTIKASLFRTLQRALKETGKPQKDVAKKLGVPQPKISDILNGKMSGFSIERLANYLLKLDYNICLDAQPAPAGSPGRVIEKKLLSA
jgi:predicted XRE-type DNA-binding protein